MLSHEKDGFIIPSKLHAIWLGGILDEEGRNNIADWRWKNKTYETNLWIDSSTYSEEDRSKLISIIRWGQEECINICDINPKLRWNIYLPNYLSRPVVYEKMENLKLAQYFNDEISGQYSNYAAASDILRVAILFGEGGVYFDARDKYSAKPLPKIFMENNDFLCTTLPGLNNDLLASIPQGETITRYAKTIKTNYEFLYQRQHAPMLFAHRNPNCDNFSTSLCTRKKTTMQVSGPIALQQTLSKVYGHLESGIKACAFPTEYYQQVAKQDLSWYDTKPEQNSSYVVALLRNYIREFIIKEIDHEINQINAHNTSQQSALLQYENSLPLLKQLKKSLLAFDTSTMTLESICRACSKDLRGKGGGYNKNMDNMIDGEKEKFNQILSKMISYAKSTDRLAELCLDDRINVAMLYNTLKKIKYVINRDEEGYLIGSFVHDVLFSKKGKLNEKMLGKYGIELRKGPVQQSILAVFHF